MSSSGPGWLPNLWSLFAGSQPLGIIIDVHVVSQLCLQITEAKVGGAKKDALLHVRAPDSRHKTERERIQGADTLDAATRQLHAHAEKRMGDFPREWLHMFVYMNGEFRGTLDLDSIRRCTDPKRWAETDPMKAWRIR